MRSTPGATALGGRSADPGRCGNGRGRHPARAPAGGQSDPLHAWRSGRGRARGGRLDHALAPPRSTSGGSTWAARSSRSAMRRPRLFRLLELLRGRRAARRLWCSAFPLGFVGAAEAKEALIAASAAACRTSRCAAGAAAARWPQRRSTLSPGGAVNGSEPWLNVIGIGDAGLASLERHGTRLRRDRRGPGRRRAPPRHGARARRPSACAGAARSKRRSTTSRRAAAAASSSSRAAIRCGSASANCCVRHFGARRAPRPAVPFGLQPGLRAARLAARRGRPASASHSRPLASCCAATSRRARA